MADQNRTIQNPSSGLFGVSILEDGTFENIGIGTFCTEQADEIAKRLINLAEKIRLCAARKHPLAEQ